MTCRNCPGLCILWHHHKVVFENEKTSEDRKTEYEFKKNIFGKLKAKKVYDETKFISIEDKSRE